MKKHHTTKSTKHTPPSVPKCVFKSQNGYRTRHVKAKQLGCETAFWFKKESYGYDIYYNTSYNESGWKKMSADVSLSPQTRSLMSSKSTLTKAIAAVNEWLGEDLPEIK